MPNSATIPKIGFGGARAISQRDRTILRTVWAGAAPLLRQGQRKDFVLHTQGVTRGMGIIASSETALARILLPAAILHDVGWSKVDSRLQMSDLPSEKELALRLHISYAPDIIASILCGTGYSSHEIDRIIDIVMAHKFQAPSETAKRLLIDADGLSDIFKPQFWSDVRSYRSGPLNLLAFRRQQKITAEPFFTERAATIFAQEAQKREAEIKKGTE